MAAYRGWSDEELERRADGLAAVIRRAWRAVARAVSTALGSKSVVTLADAAAVAKAWDEQVEGPVLAYVAETYRDAARSVLAVAVDGAGGEELPLVGDDLVNHYITTARNRLRGVGDDVWSDVREQLALGSRAGESPTQVARRVRNVAGVSPGRAATIARTEVHAAHEAAAYAQAEYVGGGGTKRWLATRDDRTRPTHRAMLGTDPVPVSQPFVVGGSELRFPGDPLGEPGEVINCRCSTAYDFDIISTVSSDGEMSPEGALVAAAWKPEEHPRGKGGKFIKAGFVKTLLSAKTPFVGQVLNAVHVLDEKQWNDLSRAQQDYVKKSVAKLPSGSKAHAELAQKLEKFGAGEPNVPGEATSKLPSTVGMNSPISATGKSGDDVGYPHFGYVEVTKKPKDFDDSAKLQVGKHAFYAAMASVPFKAGTSKDPEWRGTRTYQSMIAERWNKALRTGKPFQGTTEEKARVADAQKSLDALLDKSSMRYDIRTWRGVKDHDGKILATLKKGTVFEDKGYGSVSTEKSVGEQFAGPGGLLFDIELPKGSRGVVPTQWTTRFLEEWEVILPRGSRYEVLEDPKKVGNRTVVKVRVITDLPSAPSDTPSTSNVTKTPKVKSDALSLAEIQKFIGGNTRGATASEVLYSLDDEKWQQLSDDEQKKAYALVQNSTQLKKLDQLAKTADEVASMKTKTSAPVATPVVTPIAAHKGALPGAPAKVTTTLVWGKYPNDTVILETADGKGRVRWDGVSKKYSAEYVNGTTGEWKTHDQYTKKDFYDKFKTQTFWKVPGASTTPHLELSKEAQQAALVQDIASGSLLDLLKSGKTLNAAETVEAVEYELTPETWKSLDAGTKSKIQSDVDAAQAKSIPGSNAAAMKIAELTDNDVSPTFESPVPGGAATTADIWATLEHANDGEVLAYVSVNTNLGPSSFRATAWDSPYGKRVRVEKKLPDGSWGILSTTGSESTFASGWGDKNWTWPDGSQEPKTPSSSELTPVSPKLPSVTQAGIDTPLTGPFAGQPLAKLGTGDVFIKLNHMTKSDWNTLTPYQKELVKRKVQKAHSELAEPLLLAIDTWEGKSAEGGGGESSFNSAMLTNAKKFTKDKNTWNESDPGEKSAVVLDLQDIAESNTPEAGTAHAILDQIAAWDHEDFGPPTSAPTSLPPLVTTNGKVNWAGVQTAHDAGKFPDGTVVAQINQPENSIAGWRVIAENGALKYEYKKSNGEWAHAYDIGAQHPAGGSVELGNVLPDADWVLKVPNTATLALSNADGTPNWPMIEDEMYAGSFPDGTVIAVNIDPVDGPKWQLVAKDNHLIYQHMGVMSGKWSDAYFATDTDTASDPGNGQVSLGSVGAQADWKVVVHDPQNPIAAPSLSNPVEPDKPDEPLPTPPAVGVSGGDISTITASEKAFFKGLLKSAGVGYWSKPEKIWDAVQSIMTTHPDPSNPGQSKYTPLQVLKALDSQLKTKTPDPFITKMTKWATTAKGDAYLKKTGGKLGPAAGAEPPPASSLSSGNAWFHVVKDGGTLYSADGEYQISEHPTFDAAVLKKKLPNGMWSDVGSQYSAGELAEATNHVTWTPTEPKATAAPSLDDVVGTGDVSHISTATKEQIYSSFKKQPSTYLTSQSQDVYAALKTISDDHGLSLLQGLRVVDEVGAGKVKTTNQHLFEKKITDWLKTPEGAALASGKPLPTPPTPNFSPGVDPNTNVASFGDTNHYSYDTITTQKATSLWKQFTTAHGDAWTASQQSALKTYTGGSYYSINSYLYGKLNSISDTYLKVIKNAQLGMRPSTTPLLLHRGVGFNGIANAKNHSDLEKAVGSTWKSGGFFSTSVAGTAAFSGKPVILEVEAPPGTPMAWVKPISNYKSENEMLLAAGLHYRIISVKKEGGKSVVRIRVVPAPAGEVTT